MTKLDLCQIVKIDVFHNRRKTTVISRNAGKALDKIHQSFMIFLKKTLNKPRIELNIFTCPIIRSMCLLQHSLKSPKP